MHRSSLVPGTAIAAGVIVAAAAARADYLGVCIEDVTAQIQAIPGQVVPEGHVVYRFHAVFDDPDDVLLNTYGVKLSVTGAIFQDTLFGSDIAPNSNFNFVSQTLQADSYIAIDDVDSADGNDTVPGEDFLFDEMAIVGNWFDSNPATPATAGDDGRVVILQVTVPEGTIASGTGTILWDAGGAGIFVDSTIVLFNCAGACPADLTGSGAVGPDDLGELLANWGECPGCASDLTGDGQVNAADLAELLASWGPCK